MYLSIERAGRENPFTARQEIRSSFTLDLRFRSEGGFTVKKLIDCIVEFEKEDRPKTKFDGGIDCSHVYFEGLNFSQTHNAYSISWGS